MSATEEPEASLHIFMNIFIRTVDKHAPMKKCAANFQASSVVK